MRTCTRELQFDYGHRILQHESKCRSPHGHRGVIQITVGAERLDDLGRVIDFGKVKEIIGGWVDANWDHTMILHVDDPWGALFTLDTGENEKLWGARHPYFMSKNPTAENMVEHLYKIASGLLQPEGIVVTHVRLYETPNCWADFAPPHPISPNQSGLGASEHPLWANRPLDPTVMGKQLPGLVASNIASGATGKHIAEDHEI